MMYAMTKAYGTWIKADEAKKIFGTRSDIIARNCEILAKIFGVLGKYLVFLKRKLHLKKRKRISM